MKLFSRTKKKIPVKIFRITTLRTEKIGKKLWILTHPLTYSMPFGLMTVPKNFITDGASCPKLLYSLCTPMSGLSAEAAVLHDYLYSKDSDIARMVSRKVADLFFRAGLLSEGVSITMAAIIFAGVRIGGAASFKKCYSLDKIKE